jgi:hypothetical protein
MTRYVWRNDAFYDRATGKRMRAPDRVCSPTVQSDVSYVSPLSMTPITSRSQRREEMKVHNVREVDPSEYKPVYRTRKWAERMGGEHDPKAGMPDYGDAQPFKRMAKDELPTRIAKTVEKRT